jgi:hypothetical protein
VGLIFIAVNGITLEAREFLIMKRRQFIWVLLLVLSACKYHQVDKILTKVESPSAGLSNRLQDAQRFLAEKYKTRIAVVFDELDNKSYTTFASVKITCDSYKVDNIDDRELLYFSIIDTISSRNIYHCLGEDSSIEDVNTLVLVRNTTNILLSNCTYYHKNHVVSHIMPLDYLDFKIAKAIAKKDSGIYNDALLYADVCDFVMPQEYNNYLLSRDSSFKSNYKK